MYNVSVLARPAIAATLTCHPEARVYEHPVIMSTTTDPGARPAVPANDSSLVITTPRSVAAPVVSGYGQTSFGF